MKGFRRAALAGAIAIVTGAAPASPAHAQNRDAIVRAFDVGRAGRIGVTVQDLEESDARDAKQARAGVAVETVEPGSPADKAGVKAGDAITEFDGERVRSARQFSRLVQETPVGRSVPVALSRGGQRLTVTVTPERLAFNDDFAMRLLDAPPRPAMPALPSPPRAPRAPSIVPPPAPSQPFESFRLITGRRLGISLETLDDQLAQYFGVKEGVLVKSVVADSAAQKAGVKAGDVITSVNGRHVYDASDVNRALDRLENDDEFTLEVVRDKKPQTLKGKFETRVRGRGFVS